jgi:metal-sulfur cluster biosynthetic enzyme
LGSGSPAIGDPLDSVAPGAAAGVAVDSATVERIADSAIWDALAGVTDPELPVSIVDLGMVYGVSADEEGRVAIELTFTSIGCPAMDMLLEDVDRAVRRLPGVIDVMVDVVWSPPWTKARLTPRGRRLLMAYGLSV